ncbi:MAG: SDR family oxidoreductase [Dehalococcoidia bacterium]|nr:SDR family oxidoreductase [Dehalococcoidia bacterium]
MQDRFSLEGRTAIVTGASRGIGFAIARAFIDAGARVIITARGEEALRKAADELGPWAIAIPCDNADTAAIAAMVQQAAQLGPIDILVNNAGISPYYKRVEHVTPDEFDQVVDVNMRGMYFCSVEVARRAFEAGRPLSIMSISSILGIVPGDRLGVYSGTKAAVHQLMRTMALEWADRNVRVNAIAPGYVDTDFTSGLMASRHGDAIRASIPMGRLAQAEDIVGAALFLASDASSYVTGTILRVDGGRSLK